MVDQSSEEDGLTVDRGLCPMQIEIFQTQSPHKN